MAKIEKKLKDLGLYLPEPLKVPAGLTLPFRPVLVRGNRAYISGHAPQDPDGSISKPLGKLTVEKIMTAPICTIEGSQSVDDAQAMMADLGVRHLGVTKNGEITGVVSVRDILSFYKRYAQSKVSTETTYSEPKIMQD